MRLHQRDVLVGGRVVDDIRRVMPEDFFDLPLGGDVTHLRHDLGGRPSAAQLQLQGVQAALRPLEQHEQLGAEGEDLPT